MKILILGNNPFVSIFIDELNNQGFLDRHNVDFINSSNAIFKKKRKPKFSESFLRIRKINFERILLRLFLFFNKKFEKHHLTKLFKENYFLKNVKNKVNKIEFNGLDNIKDLEKYDFLIIATFGKKIPAKIFNKPKICTLNIHPSILPSLRGGYPTYVQAFFSSQIKGVTIHKMDEGFDTGKILLQQKFNDQSNSSNHLISEQAARIAAKLIVQLESNNFSIELINQSENLSSHCKDFILPKFYLSDIRSDENINNYVRANFAEGLFPYTFTTYYGGLFIILNLMESQIHLKSWKNKKIKRLNNKFYLIFDSKTYIISNYIYIPFFKFFKWKTNHINF